VVLLRLSSSRAVRESVSRPQAALRNSGYRWPGPKVTINLAPAWCVGRKPQRHGNTVDLPARFAASTSRGPMARLAGASSSVITPSPSMSYGRARRRNCRSWRLFARTATGCCIVVITAQPSPNYESFWRHEGTR